MVLVIDDLHELRSPEALRWLEHALARVPPKVQVVLSTREDPGLGLHRLRLTGDLEIRGGDLRFSPEETGRLLPAAGVALPDAAVARLHERTEGWAAGLRLAAISLAAHPDRERFVAEFSGSERTVAAYLLAEVLERQPAEVRDLLLRTSILDRVSGPLADFLTGGSGSEAILQRLEDASAFVTSLDAGRTWFRYHHLFADLLRLELRGSLRRDRAASPRRRRVVRAHEDMVEAIRHAQAAGDWPTAARMVADNYVSLVFDGRLATLRALLEASRRTPPTRTRSWRSPSRRAASTTACSRRARATSRRRSAGPTRSATSAGSASTCSWRRRGSRSRVAAAIWPPSRRRCARSRLRWPRSRRAPGGSATTSGPPRS